MPLLPPETETLFGLPVPPRLCGVVRGEFTNFELSQPGEGYDVAYESPLGKLNLYIYGDGASNLPTDLREPVHVERFKSELSSLLAFANRPGSSAAIRDTFDLAVAPTAGLDFRGATLKGKDVVGNYDSFVLLGSKSGKFIKLRGTGRLGPELFDRWFAEIASEYTQHLWPERVEERRRDDAGAIDDDPAGSFETLLEAAATGDPSAQLLVAESYFEGRGISSDAAVGVLWTRRAADQGLAAAEFNLGLAFANGEGVVSNLVEANRWYRLAAKQGHADAQYQLGLACWNGRGCEKDPAEAFDCFRQAAAQGHAAAQTNVGYCYSMGAGVEQDSEQAMQWYLSAAARGNADAQQNLGDSYLSGRHVMPDPVKSTAWYRLAAEQGHARAQNNLGVSYATGRGVTHDLVQAYLWFHLASAAGLKDAVPNRDTAATMLTPEQLDSVRGLLMM